MGGSAKAVGKAADYVGQRVAGGDSRHYENMGKDLDENLGDKWDKEAGDDPIGRLIDNTYGKLDRYVTRQLWGGGGPDDPPPVEQRDTSAFAQSKKPRKKKKGLLALNTPSAKKARFKAGKRRFRVRPTGKTGVSVAGSSNSSVGTK